MNPTAPNTDRVRNLCRGLGVEARGAVVALAAVKLWGPAAELSWWWVASPALSLLVTIPIAVLFVRALAARRLRIMTAELERRAEAARAIISGTCSSGCPSTCEEKPKHQKLSEAARQRVERMMRRRSSRNRNDRKD